MIRRDIRIERDPRMVKWSLIAAAFALSVGCYADMVISAEADLAQKATSTMVGEAPVADVPPVTVAS